jgi:putative Mn2+ efflux pump MntP
MIYDSFQAAEEQQHWNAFSNRILLGLGVATSIDALAVGVSMAFLELEIGLPAFIIALTTFSLSLIGVIFGFRFGQIKHLKVELVGGVILIVIGIKILAEHTLLN